MEHPDHRDRRSVIWRRQSATASSALIAPAWPAGPATVS